MFGVVALAVALAAPDPANAAIGQLNLADLQALCGERSPSDACRFYVLGVMEGVSIASDIATDSTHFCIPSGVTQTEVVAIVKRLAASDLERFPGDRALPAVSFVSAVLAKTYPCAAVSK